VSCADQEQCAGAPCEAPTCAGMELSSARGEAPSLENLALPAEALVALADEIGAERTGWLRWDCRGGPRATDGLSVGRGLPLLF
jgi:hypothetical protein